MIPDHMTPTWVWFWKATYLPLYSHNSKCLSLFDLHHTSHITYCMWNCKFYKRFRIIVVLHFSYSIKLILNKILEYMMMEVNVMTLQKHRLSPKLFKPNIQWWKATSLKRLDFINPKKLFTHDMGHKMSHKNQRMFSE